MLRVDAMPNYNNQTTFNGKFICTPELDMVRLYATDKEVAKFKQLVAKMQDKNDNKVYKLTKMVMTSISEVNKYLILYCRNTENYKLRQNLIKKVDLTPENKDTITENIYDGALKSINKILSRRYDVK